MRQTLVIAALLGGIALFASCTGDRASMPTAPPGAAQFRYSPTSCAEISQRQIDALVPAGARGSVTSQLSQIRNDAKKGNLASARSGMFALWNALLQSYYAGALTGGTSLDTRTSLIALGEQLYCLVGLDGSALGDGIDPLNPQNVVQVVFPSPNTQTVTTGDAQSGVQIPGNTLTQPVTIAITRITDVFGPFAGPLDTKLDQYGPFFLFRVIPEQDFSQEVLAASCLTLPDAADLPPRIHLAHNVGEGIEILPREDPNFLQCNGTGELAPTVRQLVRSREYGRAALRAGALAIGFFAPTSLYAGSLGVGGKTKSFSPFGGVDTLVEIVPNSETLQFGVVGSPVASPPSALVRTTGAHTPLGGASVTFDVGASGGTITAPNDQTPLSTLTLTTGDGGTATVGSWTLASAQDTVFATALFPSPVGVTVGGRVTYIATTGAIIPYGAGDWKYQAGPAGQTPGFEASSFDDSGWSTGTAAFGDHTPENPFCEIDAHVRTHWNSAPAPTDMLLRHAFQLPAGFTGDLQVGVAIDNDVQVFVNGSAVSDLVSHEGCATENSFVFTVPNSLLNTGPSASNVLAVRARDRGVAAFVDVELATSRGQEPVLR